MILIFKKYGLALFLVCSLLSHIIKLSYQLVVQKLNLAFARIVLWSFRSFWLVDTPVEIFWPHEISLNVVSSLAFLIPLLESPLVIVFPYLQKTLSQIFQENGFCFTGSVIDELLLVVHQCVFPFQVLLTTKPDTWDGCSVCVADLVDVSSIDSVRLSRCVEVDLLSKALFTCLKVLNLLAQLGELGTQSFLFRGELNPLPTSGAVSSIPTRRSCITCPSGACTIRHIAAVAGSC